MVSKASEDLPEPDRPVNTMSRSRGRSSEMFRRLCSRAPRITRESDTRADPIGVVRSHGEHLFCSELAPTEDRGARPRRRHDRGVSHTRVYRDGVVVATDIDDDQISEALAEPGTVVWVDLCNPTATQLERLAA